MNNATNTDTAPVTAPAPAPAADPAPAPAPAPANSPSEPGKTSQPGTSVPEFTAEAAARLDAAYALSEPAPQDDAAAPAQPAAPGDYAISFPDSFAQHPEAGSFSSILAPIAQSSGIDGAAFGKLFADSYAAIEDARLRAEWQNRFQQDLELKQDWGADYETNMRAARAHIAFLKEKAGLSDSDLACFQSPKGMRALYAMASAHAAPPAAGLATAASEQSWAKAVMQPGHPDHDAFTNPMHPRYREINQRWLRANGQ